VTASADAAPARAAATGGEPAGETAGETFGPWNPGIESQLPRELLPLATHFRPENVRTRLATALELADFTGLDIHDLVAFRPERLVLHELLVRVTADFAVPSGSRVEDLGINFREMVDTLLTRHLASRMPEVVAAYDALRARIASVVESELSARLDPPVPAHCDEAPRRGAGWIRRLLGSVQPPSRSTVSAPSDAGTDIAIAAWRGAAQAPPGEDRLRAAACRALARTVAAIVGRHGDMSGTRGLVVAIATDLACNDYGSEAIGALIDPRLGDAARAEGYRLLPAQERPVIMNTKGASAAGKSTMRPEQKTLAARIGVAWGDFALISPDIWRKQLLDYASLGAAYKYGGACTSEELRIIDQKLDRYMARKAERRATTHLLIDRFRFDSFAPESAEAGSNLLTRFGHTVYLFFMITPPESLVERAWKRGLEVGRYKAVDDILAHNIEAYAGMPEIFFTWALRADKEVHCEFLDNTVPFGARPLTIAFGWNGELNILDVGALLAMQGFRKVNVDAKGPGELYEGRGALAPQNNTGFLVECARRLPIVNFADQATGRIYLRVKDGSPQWADRNALDAAMADPATRTGLLAVAPSIAAGTIAAREEPAYLATHLGAERIHTLGRWGPTP
jgi:hypothetical protein